MNITEKYIEIAEKCAHQAEYIPADEELQFLRDECLSDSTKIIRYLEEQKAEQAVIEDRNYKIAKISLVLTGICVIASIISVIIAVIALKAK